jgi:PTS system cellobiose-specific IIB component
VLVGQHLAYAIPTIERDAAIRGTTVVLLPDDIFTDLDGNRTLQLVQEALERADADPPRVAAPPTD